MSEHAFASVSDVLGVCGAAWDQGDIVDRVYFACMDSVTPGILLTPACDIEHEKVDTWTFVALFPDVDVARAITQRHTAGWTRSQGGTFSNSQRGSLERTFRELMMQRIPRYHWVPVRIGASEAHVADFTRITSIPVEEIKEGARRLATLRSSFREQLPARYASYMARVGTSDILPAEIDLHVRRLLGFIESSHT